MATKKWKVPRLPLITTGNRTFPRSITAVFLDPGTNQEVTSTIHFALTA